MRARMMSVIRAHTSSTSCFDGACMSSGVNRSIRSAPASGNSASQWVAPHMYT